MKKAFFAFVLASVFAQAAETADRVLVLKSERKLQLLHSGKVLKEYRVALGRSPTGHKQKEGDGRTPEGVYKIDFRNSDSRFHRSLHISFRTGKTGRGRDGRASGRAATSSFTD